MTNNKNTRRGPRNKANQTNEQGRKDNTSEVTNSQVNPDSEATPIDKNTSASTDANSKTSTTTSEAKSADSVTKSTEKSPEKSSTESKAADSKASDSKAVDSKNSASSDASKSDASTSQNSTSSNIESAKATSTKASSTKDSSIKDSDTKTSSTKPESTKTSDEKNTSTTSPATKPKSDEKTVKNDQTSNNKNQSQASTTSPQTKPKCGKGKRLIFAVILALLIAGLAFVAFQAHQLNQRIQGLEQSKAQNNNAGQAQLAAQFKALSETQAKLNSLIGQQQYQARQLSAVTTALPGVNKKNMNDWVLAEASYFLTIAERRIALESDVQTALQLLIEADKSLASLNDLDLLDIRKAIAEDITKLQAIKPIDQEGLVLKLMALQKVIPELALRTRLLSEEEKTPPTSVSNDVKDWKQNIQISFDQFVSSFVTFRAHNGDVPHLLTGDQHFYLQENLKSKLDSAMQGIRYQNDQMYQESLQIAYDWSQVYFNREAHQVQQFNKELEALKAQSIKVEQPKALTSPKLLKTLVAVHFGQEPPADVKVEVQGVDPTKALEDKAFEDTTLEDKAPETETIETEIVEIEETADVAENESTAPEQQMTETNQLVETSQPVETNEPTENTTESATSEPTPQGNAEDNIEDNVETNVETNTNPTPVAESEEK